MIDTPVKIKEKKDIRIITLGELLQCPKCIINPSHWIPRHKVEECGGCEIKNKDGK